MNIPGSPRLHVWLGIILAFAGALIGGYAYTGERIYEIVYLPVALVGLVLLVAGSALAGYGQANRPRLGGAPSDEEETPSLLDRARAWLSDRGASQGDDETAAQASDGGAEAEEPPDAVTEDESGEQEPRPVESDAPAG